MKDLKNEALLINLDDIKIDDDIMTQRVAQIDKDLEFLKDDNASELSQKRIEAIEKNYKNQLVANPFANISSKQVEAIDMIIKGETKTQICKQLGISRSALNNWYKNDRFLELLDNTKRDIEESNKAYFKNLVPKALKRLEGILDDDEVSSRELLGAVKLVLEGASITSQGDAKYTHNQTQIIISPVKPKDDVREIENEIIDVPINKKSD